ncbi:nad binding nadp oxidoreductase coenzyme f420 [Paramyrothecium foliicola]|nr:nad binding nadp oxidoreductase coenzyme f420 [Paramyrothecium foliicola]
MALNLARRYPLTVWNRTPSKYALLQQAGAKVADTPRQLVQDTDVIFTMLFNEAALTSVIDAEFRRALRGKTLINTGSASVDFSKSLANQIREAGGQFIEMPVSGSKIPAEQGQLIGMIAGCRSVAEKVRPVVEPITKEGVYCGEIGMGLKTKYAVNLYLITMTAGLAESMALARAQGLDIEAFGQFLNAGPMASAYSKIKLIDSASAALNAQTPLIHLSGLLYKQAIEQGFGEHDMIAIEKVLGRNKGNKSKQKEIAS